MEYIIVSDVGRTTSGSASFSPPAWVTTANSGENPSTCAFSFDKKENLWTSSDGNHGIPFLRTYTKEEGDYAFGVNTFEYDFVGNNGCLMAFFEK